MITIDDFKKLNIVVGTIEQVEDTEGSKKLYKFTIDIGTEKRQILGGLKLAYTKEELMGKQVLVLANLATRKIMGLESQGMILAAGEEKPTIISPTTPLLNGSIIK